MTEEIDKSQLTPLYDTAHECMYVKDDEETDEYYAVKCMFCPRGRLIRK